MQDKWYKVEDKIPADGERVLTWDSTFDHIEIAYYNEKYKGFQEQDEFGDFIDGYTEYWMPLPKSPKD